MSSSVQNYTPVQWLLTQLPNSFGLSGDLRTSHKEEEHYYPQDYIENISEQFLNFENPVIQGLKVVNSSAKTLQNILNTNIFKKPFIIWNTSSEGNNNIHKPNCLNICESKKRNFYNHTLQLQKIITNSGQLKGNIENSASNNCAVDLYQKLDSSRILVLEVKNRMVTSRSSNENNLCNIQPQLSKKKLKNSAKQIILGDSVCNSVSKVETKETQILVNPERDRDSSVTNHDPKIESAGLEKDIQTIENKSGVSCESGKLLSDESSCSIKVNLKQAEIINPNQRCSKSSELQEVGKILEDVLWKRPVTQSNKLDELNNASSEGSDTGYSSRCSTPPSPSNSSDSNTENKIKEDRLILNNIPFSIENSMEHRSPSPSECSESSQGPYQPKPPKKYCFEHYYQQNSSQNNYGSYSAKNDYNNCYYTLKQTGFNNRPNYSLNNNYKLTVYPNGSRKFQNCFANNSSYNSNQQNSSHYNNDLVYMGGKYPYNNEPRHFNYNHESKNNWSYNQRHVGRGRQYIKNVHNNYQPQLNHQQSINSNSCHSNPQFDVRDVVPGFQRKLHNSAGIFTVNKCTKWVKDYRAEATIIPPELLTGSDWDDLSLQLWKTFAKHQQLESTLRAKMELKDRICRVIRNILPMGHLFVVGSSLSGFGANSSDVDMCLMVTPKELDQRNDAQAILRLLQRELNNCGFAEKMELITAKVPILKFRDSKTGIDVDLNCNNSVGIRNTHLLNAYSQLDWRVRPLVLVVKLWAQHHNINNAKDMTISSYSLVLMVIHYLQHGTPTPLLPCLHNAYPDKFNSYNLIFKIPVTERIPLFISNNKQTLGELFLGFLEYYAEKFKFIETTISVRVGGILPTEECRFAKTKKNDSRMWKYLCIEEPFDLTNTARSVYDEDVFGKVKNVFKDSVNKLKKTKDLSNIIAH